jgi:hypothetical protein
MEEKMDQEKAKNNLLHCKTAPSAEHARGSDNDEPCDDGRTGKIEQKGGKLMRDETELCNKIRSLHPEIGQCGIDLDVEWDDAKKVWIVDLKKDQHELKTHLEPEDADGCMDGKQCVSLGLQIAQLKVNIENV